ncbi:MAG TPA: hypothetical protein VJ884_09155, partial [Salinibacter sp.]|nr:hypothetical protein [Salinibacter sp.]
MPLSRRHFLSLGSAGAAALATQPWTWAHASPRASASWQSAPSLPTPTQEVYCTTWNDRIVVAGGLRSGPDSNRRFTTLAGTALFDPASDQWTEGPDLPAPRHHLVLGTAMGRVYGFGGFVGDMLGGNGFQFRDDVYAFDGKQWTRVGAMPRPLGETVALSLNDRIHLITGSLHGSTEAEQGATGTHLVYDADADDWSEAAPAPTARSSATGAVIDGQLYVAGGRRRGSGG